MDRARLTSRPVAGASYPPLRRPFARASNREALARYGLTVDDLQAVIMTAVGGETIATTIEGRQRFTVNLRYSRDLRQEVDQLERVLVKAGMDGIQVPMKELASIKLATGPAMIRNENGRLAGYLYVTPATDDLGRYADRLHAALKEMPRPPGYEIKVSGQYENMQRVKERLKLIVPVTMLMIFFLLFFNTKSLFKTGIVLLAVPFSVVGAVWFLWFSS